MTGDCRGLRLLWLLLALAGPVAAAAEERPALFPNDERLARPVSVPARRVYLGELLDDLSQRTRVPLSVEDTKGPASGIRIVAYFKGLALREVIVGLAELFTHRYDQWEWQRAPGDRQGYILRHQRSLHQASAAAREDMLRRWTADARAYYEIARLPEPERRIRAADRPDLFHPNGVNWDNATLFGELNPTELNALLRGIETPLDMSRLSPWGREAFNRQVAQLPRPPPGAAPSAPGFHVTWDRGSAGPVIMCRVVDGSMSVVGGYGWDGDWLNSVKDGWRTPWDSDIKALGRKMIRNDPSVGEPGPRSTFRDWIRRAAERQELNVLLDPVHLNGESGGQQSWLGRTPEATAMALVFHEDLLWRQRGTLHLLRHRDALHHPRDHLVPWPQVESLRRAADRSGGYLAVRDLIQLGQLAPQQQYGLAGEFPDASPGPLAAWRPIFEFYLNSATTAQQRLRSPAGLLWRDAGLLARRSLAAPAPVPADPRGLPFLLEHAAAATVSLCAEETGERGQSTRLLVWQIRAPGTAGHRAVFKQQPRRRVETE